MLAQVKQIIAVASGKGGVGKSTTAVNLALALQAKGKKVGLLDADIYGPSIAMMLGVPEGTRPATADGKSFTPVMAHGLETMSMAYLVSDKTPMAWRGPMASGALQQSPIREPIAAISVGIVSGTPLLDLEYIEDSACDTDMNVVMTAAGHFVEVQGTAEGAAFSRKEMGQLLDLAEKGIAELVALQKQALAGHTS